MKNADGSISRALAAAGLLATATALLHIVGGEFTIARPLLKSSLDQEPRLVMYAVWHMASVALSLSAVALLIAAHPRYRRRAHDTVVLVGMLWIGFGLCFLSVALAEGATNQLFGELQQWTLLLPVGLLAMWGSSSPAPPVTSGWPE